MTDDAPKTPASYWADQIRADLRRRRETESTEQAPTDPTEET